MSDNGGLQLLPDTRKKLDVKTPGQNRLVFLALGFAAMILLAFVALLSYKNSLNAKLDEVNGSLRKVEEARNKDEESKLLKLKDYVALIKPLVDDHITWSEAFIRIQKLVSPQIQFDSLGAKISKNEYTFKALAPSYAAIAKQIAAFYKDSAITDLAIGKVSSLPNGRVEFTIQLVLDAKKVIRKNSPSQTTP